jgi:Family of unknown function (DUF5709)
MGQRDDEEQPQAPDLGASVQLESDQHLAASPGARDGLDAGYVPADRPYLLDKDEVTARGMREGESLDERLRRERADDQVDPDRSGRLVMEGEGAALETPDAMDAIDVGIDGGAAGAEEAAVHIVEDPGRPRETEPSVANSPALADPEVDAAVSADPLSHEALGQASRDVRADGDVFDPGLGDTDGAGGDPGAGSQRRGELVGGDVTGRDPDPPRPWGPGDVDPAQRPLPDADRARRIDEATDAGGSAAPASGWSDVGPEGRA